MIVNRIELLPIQKRLNTKNPLARMCKDVDHLVILLQVTKLSGSLFLIKKEKRVQVHSFSKV